MKGSKLFLKSLSHLGVDNIFGIVGGEAQAIQFDEVKEINFFLTRHEFAAGIMADVYGRVTGKPQVCYSTFGPGLTNLSTGVCSAILDRSPLLAVSAQIHSSEIKYNQTHQCIDNVQFMKTITKKSTEIDHIANIPQVIQESLETAVNEIPGPVYISFPIDLMQEELEDGHAHKLLDKLSPITKISPPKPDYELLNIIVNKLKKSVHPMIIIGNQVIREECCEQVVKLAEKLNIPVLCSLAAKGAISEDHPLFITAGNKYIDKIYRGPLTENIFNSCDLLLLVGYDFGEDLKPSLWNNNIETILINSFYDCMGNVFQPDLKSISDMKSTLNYLLNIDSVMKIIPEKLKLTKEVFDKRSSVEDIRNLNEIFCLIKNIRESLGKDGILCSDIGLHKQYAGLLSKTYSPNTFLCSNVCGTFGFGLPAGLGAKIAKPDTKVCVICGDGGFHSTSQDLETAVRYNIPIVIIVLKDNAFGLIKYYQFLERENIFAPSVEFGNVDFVKLAEANGMAGATLSDMSKIGQVMHTAFEMNKPFLIEVPINYKYDL